MINITKHSAIIMIIIFIPLVMYSIDFAFIQGNKVNLREKPNVNSKILAQLSQNDKVIIKSRIEINDTSYKIWYYITTSNNQSGYVFSQYLKLNTENKDKYSFDKYNLNNKKIISISEGGRCETDSGYSYIETLIFTNGKVDYSLKTKCCWSSYAIKQSGKYFLDDNKLVIELDNGMRIEQDSNTEKENKIIEKAKTIYLYWNSQLEGYITSEQNKLLLDIEYTFNKKEHYLIKKIHQNNLKLCEDPSGKGSGLEFEKIGYYK